jgi:hypothetical protein
VGGKEAGVNPTERAIAALPPHLRRFVVTQDYDAYTPRDHAVWPWDPASYGESAVDLWYWLTQWPHQCCG